ncbi:hypothetical protein MAR_035168, partial [Mya arenaria]
MESPDGPMSEIMIKLRQLGLDDLQRPTDLQSIIYERKEKRDDFVPMHTDSTEEDINQPDYKFDGPDEFGKCAECVKAVPVFAYDDIDVGDHITFYGRLYDHHAIVTLKVGDNQIKIIEATNTPAGAVFGLMFWKKAFIEETVKTFDYAKDKINVVVYKNRVFTKAKVARRQKENRDFNYNVIQNNCEHFATYCVTGTPFSIQAVKFLMVSTLFLGSGFLGISDERMRNAKLFENNFICSRCDEMNKRLLSVSVKPILSADDVHAGDVIRYTYYNLQHEGVVLAVFVVRGSNQQNVQQPHLRPPPLLCSRAFLEFSTSLMPQWLIAKNARKPRLRSPPPLVSLSFLGVFHRIDPQWLYGRTGKKMSNSWVSDPHLCCSRAFPELSTALMSPRLYAGLDQLGE